jgi:hypothetical protein
MKLSVLGLGLVLCAVTNQDVLAQDFWYVPPAYDYGYYYGIDLGNGVRYGVGIGIPLPFEALTESMTAEVQGAQGLCCDEMMSPPISAVDPAIAKLVPVKPKPTGLKAKKGEMKVQQMNSVTEIKKSKTPKHMTAKTGKST